MKGLSAPPVSADSAPGERTSAVPSPTERSLAWLLPGAALAAAFFLCMAPIAVTDFWWQLRTGELIVRTGRIPRTDPFSWTAFGQPWMVHEWLSEVIFYLVHRHLPHPALLFLKSGLATIALGLAYYRCRARGAGPVWSAALVVAAASVVRNYADLRPQMFTFVLLGILLILLDRYWNREDARLAWFLPPIFALWANLHGGVVFGIGLVGFWLAAEAKATALGAPGAAGWPAIRRFAVAWAAAAVAAGLNPNGFHVYTYPAHVLGHPQVMDYISEWWSPNFHNRLMWPFGAMLVGLICCLGVAGPGARPRWGETAVLGAMALAALHSQRNTAPFAIAAAPVMACALSDLAGRAGERALSLPLRHVGKSGALLTLLGLLAIAGRHVPRYHPSAWTDLAIGTAAFPSAACALMQEGHWPGRLYNDYIWGGYLIWRLYGSRPVFVDGRAEVYYPTKAFDDEMTIHRTEPGWDRALDRRGVEVILTQKSDSLARALRRHPSWKLAFTGPVEVVYIRSRSGNAARTLP